LILPLVWLVVGSLLVIVVGGVLLAFCGVVSRAPLGSLLPTAEGLRETSVIVAAMFALVAFVTALLVVKDWFSSDCMVYRWRRDEKCEAAAARFAAAIAEERYDVAYAMFDDEVRSSMTLEDLRRKCAAVLLGSGATIDEIQETPLPTDPGVADEFIDSWDSEVRIVLRQPFRRLCLLIHLDSREDFAIREFYVTKPPDRSPALGRED
jgi:hypothetical protein